ncbi:MAG: biotin transporter BioY [Methanohalobium sp.]|uniref:biotin transporter BioY n=1 Tax=Methanohalobium sp. TaxID=2837493 RepID=UPI00397A342F
MKNDKITEEVIDSSNIEKMVFASLFAAMTAVGAYIKLPVGPVPITLQVLFVFLAGSILGKKWGSLSMVVYILLGVAGIPVFAGGASGIGVLFGPTGGYIIGFVIAAFVIGMLTERKKSTGLTFNVLYMLIGLVIIYMLGATQLMVEAQFEPFETIMAGIAPFVIGDILSILIAAYITTRYEI